MITTFFIAVGSSILGFIIGLLPVGHLPSDVTTAITYFWGVLNAFSYVFPVATLLTCLTLILSAEAFILLFHIFRFFYKHIPFIGK